MKCQHCFTDIYYYGTSASGEKVYLSTEVRLVSSLDFFCNKDLKVKHKAMPAIEVKNG